MDKRLIRVQTFFQQNKFILAVVVVGLIFMLLPTQEDTPAQTPSSVSVPTQDMQSRLETILAQIDGVGKVKVLLTISQGERTVYVQDKEIQESSDHMQQRAETILISDAQRSQNGLVAQIFPPVYQGAVIVCQGGESGIVRLAVVEAVCDATGLTADKITVLKMK